MKIFRHRRRTKRMEKGNSGKQPNDFTEQSLENHNNTITYVLKYNIS